MELASRLVDEASPTLRQRLGRYRAVTMDVWRWGDRRAARPPGWIATSRGLSTIAVTLALAAGPLARVALAQTQASIVGTVTDETKSVLPGTAVEASDLSTGRQFAAVTDAEGQYRLLNMPPGRYRVKAELAGFLVVVVPDVELIVGESRTIPFILKVSKLEETVTVTGEPPLVNTRSTQVAGNIDRRQMEELPIAGRNWIELAMLVKGVTANDVGQGKPGATRDGDFRVNLDGQDVTQSLAATRVFGQPGLSREAIAEYQIATSMFDVSQGRALGLQVQAITRSGSNDFKGTVYGYFRDDSLNAGDFVARRVLPYSNQQVGASLGGPIIDGRLFFFATYEYERQPNTFNVTPPGYKNSIQLTTKRTHHRPLARADWQIGPSDHVSARVTRYDEIEPFGDLGGSNYPALAAHLGRDNHATSVTWSHVGSASTLHELKAGYFHYHWHHSQADGVPLTPLFTFPGLSIGARDYYPEEFFQSIPSIRYDLTMSRGKHDLKVGAEFVKRRDYGWWLTRTRGIYTFSALPADIERRFPLDAWNDPSRWDLSGLDPLVVQFERYFATSGGGARGECPLPEGCGNWSVEIPRPTTALWIGDTWRASRKLTVNFGARYDLDWGVSAPPLVNETSVMIDNGFERVDVGYKNNIRDLTNISPRGGFNWDVTGGGTLVLRGGTGLFYSVPPSFMAIEHQLINGQRLIASAFYPDGRPGFVSLDPDAPLRGVTGDDILSERVPRPPQIENVIGQGYKLPRTWQSTVGFQRQLSGAMSVEADLIYYKGWNLGSGRDVNLFYDPVTGYNLHPTRAGRPNPALSTVNYFESRGRSDNLSLATGFTRRFQDNWQLGATYTLMFFRHDTNTRDDGYTGFADNFFDVDLDDEWSRSADFQRHTVRTNGILKLPYGFTLAGAYFYGSGNYFNALYPTNQFGSGRGRRLRPDGTLIPRNSFKGEPIHKVDLRISKETRIGGGSVRITGIAEGFNLLNHANYGSYTTLIDTPNFGKPTTNAASTYQPRSGQVAIKVSF